MYIFSGSTYFILTSSTSSTLIPTETIYSVSVSTNVLTRVTDTFFDIWNENN